MTSPRLSARWGCSGAVLVVLLAMVCCLNMVTAQNDKFQITITTQNSEAAASLIQFHIKANASSAEPFSFRLVDDHCTKTNDFSLFEYPSAGWITVSSFSACISKLGVVQDYTVGHSDCDLTFSMPHVDANDEVVCYAQWATAMEESPSHLVNLTVAETWGNGTQVVLAAPVVLTPPLTWDVATKKFSLGEMSVRFVQGKDALWPGTPKEMTKDKVVINVKNANLEPFAQYELSRLRLEAQNATYLNLLRHLREYQVINAYAAQDVRVWGYEDGLFILTGAHPASDFVIEFTFSNFLAQYYHVSDLRIAPPDQGGVIPLAKAVDGDVEGSTQQSPRHGGGAAAAVAAAAAAHHAKAFNAQKDKTFFAQRQQQQKSQQPQLSPLAQQHTLLQVDDELTLYCRISRVGGGDEEIDAVSGPLPIFKRHQLWPSFRFVSGMINPYSETHFMYVMGYEFYATKQNFTITLGMSGYHGGFKNAQELLAYYGNAAQLMYSCDSNGNTQFPFNITTTSISGSCAIPKADESATVMLFAVLPAAKLFKPFKIPATIDGRDTHFEFVPALGADSQQPLTKHTNTELGFNLTTTFYDDWPVTTPAGETLMVKIDRDVEFTTPMVYSWRTSSWLSLTAETLNCAAYRGDDKLSLQNVSTRMSSFMFQDKKLEAPMKAGQNVTLVCTVPLNVNAKPVSHGATVAVTTPYAYQTVDFDRKANVTEPNEDWLQPNSNTTTYDEAISAKYIMSPAPKSIAEAKQRIIQLLKTAQCVDGAEDAKLTEFKQNISEKDVFIDWHRALVNTMPKFSALTEGNGWGKALELNKKFSALNAFSGEDNRVIYDAFVNTTAVPGFSAALSTYRFTTANAEEVYHLESANGQRLRPEYEITTLDTADLSKTHPVWMSDDGWACSAQFQCEYGCVDGRCRKNDLPFGWYVLDTYQLQDHMADLTDFYEKVRNTNPQTGPNNAAFGINTANVYYVVVMAAIAVVAMMF